MTVKELVEELFRFPIGLSEEPFIDKAYPKEPTIRLHKHGVYKPENTKSLAELYEALRSRGMNVYEASQEDIFRKFGYAMGYKPVGWRIGDDIYVAKNDGKTYNDAEKRMEIALHEYHAGYDHFCPDTEAQRMTVKAFSPGGEFENAGALAYAMDSLKRLHELN